MQSSLRSLPGAAPRRTARRALALVVALAAWVAPVAAQPARILVPFPAGGAADFMGRVLAEKLKVALDRNVIVENRPGAGSRIATETLKQSTSDGSTVLLAAVEPLLIAPHVFSKVSIDLASDFTAITDVAEVQFGLTASGAGPHQTLADYVSAAKADRNRAMLGITSFGTTAHFYAFDFISATQADISLVPFQGGPALVTNVLGGQIPAVFDATTVFMEQHRSKKLRILAVSGRQRSSLLPDVPTFAESGYPSVVGGSVYMLLAPAATSGAEIDRWNRAMQKVLNMPDVRRKLEQVGYEVSTGLSRADTQRRIQAISDRLLPLVKASKFKAD